MAVATVQEKREEDGGLFSEKFAGLRPLEHRKTPFWNMGEICCRH